MLSPQLTADLASVLLTIVSPRPAPIRLVANDLSRAAGQTVTGAEVEQVIEQLSLSGFRLRKINTETGRHVYAVRDGWPRVQMAGELAVQRMDGD